MMAPRKSGELSGRSTISQRNSVRARATPTNPRLAPARSQIRLVDQIISGVIHLDPAIRFVPVLPAEPLLPDYMSLYSIVNRNWTQLDNLIIIRLNMKAKIFLLAPLILVLAVVCALVGRTQAQEHAVFFRNATIIDGTGPRPFAET